MIRDVLQSDIFQMTLHIVHNFKIFRLVFILVTVRRFYRIPVMAHHLCAELSKHADQNLIGKCIVKEVLMVYI